VGRYPVSFRPVAKEEMDHLRLTMEARLAAAILASLEYPRVVQLLANDDVHPDEDVSAA
jgi:hypothetical protein